MLVSSGQGLPLAVNRPAERKPRSALLLFCNQCPYRHSSVPHRPSWFARNSGIQLQTSRVSPVNLGRRCDSLVVQAQKGQPDPPDAPREERRGGREWLQTLLSRFGPITQKAENTAVLDFEKPLVELDNRIKEVNLVLWLSSTPSLSRQVSLNVLHVRNRYARLRRKTVLTSRSR